MEKQIITAHKSIIDYFNRLGDKELLNFIVNKLEKIEYKVLSDEEYLSQFPNTPGVTTGTTVYLRNEWFIYEDYLSTIIHETLHALSSSEKKFGFIEEDSENKIYGNLFNEAATVLLTEIIEEKKDNNGYPRELIELFKLFCITLGLRYEDTFKLYFSKEKWLTDNLSCMFDGNNNENLRQFVNLFDPSDKIDIVEKKDNRLKIIISSLRSNDRLNEESIEIINNIISNDIHLKEIGLDEYVGHIKNR